MNIIQKGVTNKRDEDTKLNVLVSHKEVEDFVRCGQHVGQDNVLFFNKNSIEKEVFLLLHGASNGTVLLLKVCNSHWKKYTINSSTRVYLIS